MKRLAAVFLSVCITIPFWSLAEAAEPKSSATSAILMDAESGRILYEQNAHEQRLIASITKLMTALVAVESTPGLDQIVEIKREYTLTEGSSMYLKVGEEVTLEGLLYGLLMASGNDAALAIAGFCAGDVETFVDWMNQRAKDIGMDDTHFSNPNGLNDDKHYSTAADMAKLAQVVMQDETLSKIVGTKNITIAGRSFTNHNKLLWRYEGCIGMKTGYTDKAGRTLVSCAERNGQRLIVVTLNDPDDWKDHAALFDYGFETFPRHVLALEGKQYRSIPVSGSLLRFVPVQTESDVFYPLTAQERVKAEVVLPERVNAPVTNGSIAGNLSFLLDGEVIGETYLVYAMDVANNTANQQGLFDRFMSLFCSSNRQISLDDYWNHLLPVA